MPSTYLLAHEKVEQGRALLASEVWFDAALDRCFTLLLARLEVLDSETADVVTLLARRDDNGPRLSQRQSDSSVIPFIRR